MHSRTCTELVSVRRGSTDSRAARGTSYAADRSTDNEAGRSSGETAGGRTLSGAVAAGRHSKKGGKARSHTKKSHCSSPIVAKASLQTRLRRIGSRCA